MSYRDWNLVSGQTVRQQVRSVCTSNPKYSTNIRTHLCVYSTYLRGCMGTYIAYPS